MRFKDRLKDFMAEQEKRSAEAIAREEKEEVLREKSEGEKRKKIEECEEIIRERFVSFFNAVNEVFLDDKGEVEIFTKPNSQSANLRLKWNDYTYIAYGEEGGSGNRINLTLYVGGSVVLFGGRRGSRGETYGDTTKFKLSDDNWRQKLEDGILTILSDSRNFHWKADIEAPIER